MTDRAKLFKNGGSQAVRLPKKYRFADQDEVEISIEGDRVVLAPLARSWTETFRGLAGSAADFEVPAEIRTEESVPSLD